MKIEILRFYDMCLHAFACCTGVRGKEEEEGRERERGREGKREGRRKRGEKIAK